MSDNITLPREVAKLALDHIEWYIENERGGRFAEVREAAEALRTALAAEPTKPKPVAWVDCNWQWDDKEWTPLYADPPTAAPSEDVEALRRDAERYRYLRNRDPKEVFGKSGKAAGVWIDWEDDMAGLQLLTGDDAAAAIDAAMKEGT